MHYIQKWTKLVEQSATNYSEINNEICVWINQYKLEKLNTDNFLASFIREHLVNCCHSDLHVFILCVLRDSQYELE
jgi:hypothetical protein